MLKETINKKITALNICLNPYFNGTCSKSMKTRFYLRISTWVLILILMEHAQRVCALSRTLAQLTSLNPYFNGTCSKSVYNGMLVPSNRTSLNPYFNGTCSKSHHRDFVFGDLCSLNPYFNGTCSKRRYETDKHNERCKRVLILILMEHAQRDMANCYIHPCNRKS